VKPKDVPDPSDSTAWETVSKADDPDNEVRAREQAEQILAESEERTEHPSTTDLEDDTIERRHSDETA